jgi:hypothetical protein
MMEIQAVEYESATCVGCIKIAGYPGQYRKSNKFQPSKRRAGV